ncbi:hypothetical protein F01_460422 [Burkholderia cenocepacia]|nr:hypothetical protein F01_460422 [Burkholderia cenocepacia]
MAEAVNPPEVWAPFGAFSMAMIQGDGRIVHLKGQVALDRDGQVVGAGDMRAGSPDTRQPPRRAGRTGRADARRDLARPLRDRHRRIHAGRRHPQHVLRRPLSGDDDRPGRASLPSRPADRDRGHRRDSAGAVPSSRDGCLKRIGLA